MWFFNNLAAHVNRGQNTAYLFWIALPIFLVSLFMTYNVFKKKLVKTSIISTVALLVSLAGVEVMAGKMADEELIIKGNFSLLLVLFGFVLLQLFIQIVYTLINKKQIKTI